MKKIMITALVAAQLSAVSGPARAAELINPEPPHSQQMGTFVGGRIVVPLAAERHSETRATLAAAPLVRSTGERGDARTRIGQGLEFGLVGAQPRLDLARQPVSRLVQGPEAPGGPRRNISTVGWVAIGVGVLALSAFLIYGLCGSGEICDTDDN